MVCKYKYRVSTDVVILKPVRMLLATPNSRTSDNITEMVHPIIRFGTFAFVFVIRFNFCDPTLHSMTFKHVSLLAASTAVRMHRPLSQLQVLVNVVFVYEKNKRDNTISWMQYAIGMPGNSFV